ncbi:MAG: hypothetical protein ACYC36_12135 [Bellilinea sp.]
MISYDLIEIISNWIGWFPISVGLLAVIGLIVYVSEEKFKAIKLKNEMIELQKEALKEKIGEYKENSPDVLAKIHLGKIEYLKEELIATSRDKDEKDQEIIRLNKELGQKIDEVENFRTQVEQAQLSLNNLEDILPREGRVNPQINSLLMSEIFIHSALFIPVVRSRNNITVQSYNPPFRLIIEYPGMFKTILLLEDVSGIKIGRLENRFSGFYDRDYYETLLNVLGLDPENKIIEDNQSGYPSMLPLKKSQFHGVSLIDPTIFYIKIPFEAYQVLPRG